MTRQLSVLMLAGGLIAIPGASQTATSKSSHKSSQAVNAADTQFMKKVAQGGLAQVELGKLAEDKASNPDVKNFGKRMVDDHSKANDELKEVAAKNNVTLPDSMSAKDKQLEERLKKLSGDQFDRIYMQNMVADHKKDVAEFRKESKSAKNADLRDFAAKTLPTLEDHLKQAHEANGKVGAVSKKTAKTGAVSKK